MTLEELRKLPQNRGPVYHELRHGELDAVTRPKLKHTLIQSKLRDLLRPLAHPGSYIEVEIASRALPEHKLRVADVAYLFARQVCRRHSEDNVRHAPVVEVLSPSNSQSSCL
jgi:Uma2 family endonuclease